jgi:hypothetical protein
MRFAKGFFASAVVLFIAGATGPVGSWAIPVCAVALLLAAVTAAIAMEERDPGVPEALAGRFTPSGVTPADLTDAA